MRSRLVPVVASALAALAVAVALASTALARPAGTFQINVTATDFKFKLGKPSVSKGTKVVFHLINNGKLPHDFKIGGKKTPLVQPNQSADVIVTFAKPGSFPYLCTVPGHAAAGMKGTFKVN